MKHLLEGLDDRVNHRLSDVRGSFIGVKFHPNIYLLFVRGEYS